MRTSLDLDDDLMRRAKIAAIERGITLRELIGNALLRDLSETRTEPPMRKLEFPLIKSKNPGSLKITLEEIKQAELEDDLKRSGLFD
jgi:hypothetical protein